VDAVTATTGPVTHADAALAALPLSEVFGPVWQGEGPYAGRLTAFVRLGLCNLACEWCDTPYTWDSTRFNVAAENPVTRVNVIHDRLRVTGCHLATLSGGEPLMHHQRLPALLTDEWTWHVETNGTIPPPPWWADRVAHTSVSPKVATRDPIKKRIKPHALRAWADLARRGLASWKFVAVTDADVVAASILADQFQVPRDRVWIMPEGTTALTLLPRQRDLAAAVLEAGFNYSSRLHVLLYDDERRR
jgi:organic radical activating enzyme